MSCFTPGVPEPETWGIVVVGMGVIGLNIRRKAKILRVLVEHLLLINIDQSQKRKASKCYGNILE